MSGRHWFEQFAADGPEYEGRRMSGAEVQALLLKAGVGDGLPLGHAQDLSVLAPLLMSDPQLIAMAAAALDGAQNQPGIEGTGSHAVVEHCEVLMAGPMVIDAFVAGAKRVVMHDLDWPLLLWPYLAHAGQVYDLKFAISGGQKGTVMVSMADHDGLDPLGPPQSVPLLVLERLNRLAANADVPASEAPHAAGARSGLGDND